MPPLRDGYCRPLTDLVGRRSHARTSGNSRIRRSFGHSAMSPPFFDFSLTFTVRVAASAGIGKGIRTQLRHEYRHAGAPGTAPRPIAPRRDQTAARRVRFRRR